MIRSHYRPHSLHTAKRFFNAEHAFSASFPFQLDQYARSLLFIQRFLTSFDIDDWLRFSERHSFLALFPFFSDFSESCFDSSRLRCVLLLEHQLTFRGPVQTVAASSPALLVSLNSQYSGGSVRWDNTPTPLAQTISLLLSSSNHS